MIKAIAFTVYPVSSMERARCFYEDVLGLKPAESLGESWQEYDLDGGTFGLVLMSEAAPACYKNTRGTTIAFEVENLNAAADAMRKQGIDIIYGPEQYPTCGMFVIHDPDGNVVALHQLAPERAGS